MRLRSRDTARTCSSPKGHGPARRYCRPRRSRPRRGTVAHLAVSGAPGKVPNGVGAVPVVCDAVALPACAPDKVLKGVAGDPVALPACAPGEPGAGGFDGVVPPAAGMKRHSAYEAAPAKDSYSGGKFAIFNGRPVDWLYTPTMPPPGPRTRPQSGRPLIGSG